MRYCHSCRQHLGDEVSVCPVCGAAVDPAPPMPPVNSGYAEPMLSNYSAIDVLKEMGSSKLFLAAAIIFSLSTLLNIVNAFFAVSTIDLFELAGAGRYIDLSALTGLINEFARMLQIISWVSWIPTAAICAGLWMFYFACKGSSELVKTGGLTTIKVSLLCSLALSLVAVVGFFPLFLMPLMDAISDSSRRAVVTSTVIPVIIVVLLIAAVPLTFYYVLIIKTINTVKKTALTGQPSDRVSTFVAVWNFIMAGLQLFGLFGNRVDISFFTSACNINFLIMTGVAISQYKSSMRGLIYVN